LVKLEEVDLDLSQVSSLVAFFKHSSGRFVGAAILIDQKTGADYTHRYTNNHYGRGSAAGERTQIQNMIVGLEKAWSSSSIGNYVTQGIYENYCKKEFQGSSYINAVLFPLIVNLIISKSDRLISMLGAQESAKI